MVNSRAKGARREREARDKVRRHWSAPGCIRAAQAGGAYSADLLHALDDGHVEVKGHARIAALRFLEQAERDKKPDEIPVVLMREDGDADGWAVMFRIKDTERFVLSIINNASRTL